MRERQERIKLMLGKKNLDANVNRKAERQVMEKRDRQVERVTDRLDCRGTTD